MAVHPCHWASCRTTCSSDKALYEHLLQDHGRPWQNRDVERLACQWAGCKTRPNRAHLPDHLISHTDYRPLVCNVSPHCTMRFKTRRALNIHLVNVKNHLPQTAPCEWKACTETLADPPALLEHISKVHGSNDAKDICLWTECAHRSALKWKLDSCLPSWYTLILSEADERGKTSLLHAHMNTASVGTKKRKRKGGSRKKDNAATKGGADGEHKVGRAPILAQDEPDAENDDVAYVDDLKDADWTPGRRTPRLGAKRQHADGSDVGDQDKRTRTAKRRKVHMRESGEEDVADEDESYAPSLSSTSAFETSASSPAEHEQDYASTTVDERLAAAAFRIKTLEAQLAAVIRQNDVLRAEWVRRMSMSADDADGTATVPDQDAQTTTLEDDLSPDDWSLWVTGTL